MDNQQNVSQQAPINQYPNLGQPQKNNKKRIIILSFITVLVLSAFGGLYYWQNSKNQDLQKQLEATKSELEKLRQTKEASETKDTDNKTAPDVVDKQAETKKAIVVAMNNKNYESLKPYMASAVSYARQSSDTGKENASQTEAVQEFNSFGPPPGGTNATTPWDFDVMTNDTSFKDKITATNDPVFTNAYIGRSKDGGSFIAFKLDNDGKIVSFRYGSTAVL